MTTHAGRSQEDRIQAEKGEKLPAQEQAGGKMAVEGTEAGKDSSSGKLSEAGKDVWLFGGGSLFRSFLDAGLVDTVEVAIMPVLLGGGIPLLPPPAEQTKLKLTGHKVYKTGIVSLEYTIQ